MTKTYTILGLIFSAKAITVGMIFLAYSLLPFATNYYYSNFVYPRHSPITLQTAFSTWDAQHYLYLSEQGYHVGNDSNAFPFLFPFFIHLVTFLTRNSFWSGIIFSNLCSVAALFIFYRLIRFLYSEKIAFRSLLFLLIFPTSFYFSLIYTESLFFLLVMLFFLFLAKKQLLLASIVALFLPLVRLIGVAILIPFFFSYILEYYGHSLYDELRYIGKSVTNIKTLFLFSPVVGLCLSMYVMYLTTGSWLTQFTAQQNFISHYSALSIVNPLFFLKALFTYPLAIHGFTNSIIDRVFFLSFLVLLPFLYKRVSKVFFIYAAVFGLVPVLSGSFMSYTRYLLVIFPIFICLATMSLEPKYEKYIFPFAYLCILLQSLFIIMQSLNYWVA